MTIRPSALRGMLQAEMAADDWFAKMSKREQQAYIKAHPHSKFAKSGGQKSSETKKRVSVHRKDPSHHVETFVDDKGLSVDNQHLPLHHVVEVQSPLNHYKEHDYAVPWTPPSKNHYTVARTWTDKHDPLSYLSSEPAPGNKHVVSSYAIKDAKTAKAFSDHLKKHGIKHKMLGAQYVGQT